MRGGGDAAEGIRGERGGGVIGGGIVARLRRGYGVDLSKELGGFQLDGDANLKRETIEVEQTGGSDDVRE